jgi:hypothetical protein
MEDQAISFSVFDPLSFLLPVVGPTFNELPENFQRVEEFNNSNTNHISSSAKKRKPKAPTMREEDWIPLQPRLLELYKLENRKVADIQEVIKKEFDVNLTYVSQYLVSFLANK